MFHLWMGTPNVILLICLLSSVQALALQNTGFPKRQFCTVLTVLYQFLLITGGEALMSILLDQEGGGSRLKESINKLLNK